MTITALPPPPSRNAAPEDFALRADIFLGALPQLVTEINATSGEIEAGLTAASVAAELAQQAASDLVPAANAAATSADAAQSAAADAAVARQQAQSWAHQAQEWATWNTTFVVTTTAVNKPLINREACAVTVAGCLITLPPDPHPGWQVLVSVGAFTNTVVDRNGKNIMGFAENMTIDKPNVTVTLLFVDSTHGWGVI